MASNLLSDRLRALHADGIVEVVTDTGTNRYRLTPRGAALAPVIRELTRWGLPLMAGDHRGDAWRGRWAALVLDALLTDLDTAAFPPLRALFAIDDDEILLIVEPGQPARVTTGHEDDRRHDLTVRVTGTVDQLQRLLGGDPSGVTIDGDPAPLLNLLDAAGPL